MAWGELLLDYGAAGKSREIRASGGNKKQMSSEAEAGGRHRDAWGKKRKRKDERGKSGAAGRSENKARNEMETERSEEQSVQKVWKQLVEEGDVPQIMRFSQCVPPQRGFGFSEGSLARRERWEQQLWVLPSMGIYFSSSLPLSLPLRLCCSLQSQALSAGTVPCLGQVLSIPVDLFPSSEGHSSTLHWWRHTQHHS